MYIMYIEIFLKSFREKIYIHFFLQKRQRFCGNLIK